MLMFPLHKANQLTHTISGFLLERVLLPICRLNTKQLVAAHLGDY